jgi:hypothetical protein
MGNSTMMKKIERTLAAVVALGVVLAVGLIGTPTVAAEEKTVNAFAAYEGEGKVYLTGEKKGTFVGAIIGELFVESEKGPRHAGRITCPAMLQINLENGKQSGSGQCTIAADDGARVFGVWSCRGVHLLGCDGTLMLVGGTGRAAGISGSGSVTVRTTARGLVKMASEKDSVTSLGKGVLVLRNFKVKTPSK